MTLPTPLQFDDAQARLIAMASPLGEETIPLEQALGRYLATDLQARRDQPPADLSAMDGYAMRADDIAGPWTIVGESAAGHPFAGSLNEGEAIRISTGAMMPDQGGAVLLQEEAEREGDSLRLAADGEATPRHIRRAGFDFRTGQELLANGTRLSPPQIALGMSGGYSQVSVVRQPSVCVLDSGDELASDPANCPPDQIPASNGAMIAAMAAPFAGAIKRIGPVADNLEALEHALADADNCDVLVTSGGASVGDHDLVRPALEAWGAEIDFWRVAMKPGKPLMIARRGTQFILGLPGNPVSSYVTAFMFLLPLLRKLAGAKHPLPDVIQLALGEPLSATGERLEFLRARRVGGMVSAIDEQDSSALRALSLANALIRREIRSETAERGTMVNVYPLENGGIA